ncbi:MAG: twin-arginine translocase subunit TatC, partial [Nitrospira sp.]|nr:twin-arginine translocase subunit TatC [Nitrospira sp.]
ALPMYIFYEVGIISAGIFNKKKAEDQSQALVPAVATTGPGVGKPGPSIPTGGGDNEYVGVPTGGRRH